MSKFVINIVQYKLWMDEDSADLLRMIQEYFKEFHLEHAGFLPLPPKKTDLPQIFPIIF